MFVAKRWPGSLGCGLPGLITKKIDRIARHALFPALEAQGVPDAYVHLRRRLYAHGTGHIRSSNRRLALCLTSSVA